MPNLESILRFVGILFLVFITIMLAPTRSQGFGWFMVAFLVYEVAFARISRRLRVKRMARRVEALRRSYGE